MKSPEYKDESVPPTLSSAPELESLNAKTELLVTPSDTKVWKRGSALYTEIDLKPMPTVMFYQLPGVLNLGTQLTESISWELGRLEARRVLLRRPNGLRLGL